MKKYAFAGASARAWTMYMQPMKDEFPNDCELTGVYDINPGRCQYVADKVGIQAYDDFEKMIIETKPDAVIVTTVDAYHSDYIIKSLEMGCDVITEKPMTIDAQRCNAILEAEKRTKHKVHVTFNYRYAPFMTKIKELIVEGKIGDVFSVHFEWMLDRNMALSGHGTSYFRRWNGHMEKSGGLLVHKATHHFDLINWWIGQQPETVAAFGKRNLYSPEGSQKYFDGVGGKNCRDCKDAEKCPFFMKITGRDAEMFLPFEKYDGYKKDACVFSEDIDIYDTMAVNVQYKQGAMLTYSLNATCPYEGWRVVINGSKGRLEAFEPESGILSKTEQDEIHIFDLNNNITKYYVTRDRSDHGGGDKRLRRNIFLENVPDPLHHHAGTFDGANSIIIGAASNLSIRDGKTVRIDDILHF